MMQSIRLLYFLAVFLPACGQDDLGGDDLGGDLDLDLDSLGGEGGGVMRFLGGEEDDGSEESLSRQSMLALQQLGVIAGKHYTVYFTKFWTFPPCGSKT